MAKKRSLVASAAPLLWVCKILGIAPFVWRQNVPVGPDDQDAPSHTRTTTTTTRCRICVSRPMRLYGCLLFLMHVVSSVIALSDFRRIEMFPADPLNFILIIIIPLCTFCTGLSFLLTSNVLKTNALSELYQILEELHTVFSQRSKMSWIISVVCCVELVAISILILFMIDNVIHTYIQIPIMAAPIICMVYPISYVSSCVAMSLYINLGLLLFIYLKNINDDPIFRECVGTDSSELHCKSLESANVIYVRPTQSTDEGQDQFPEQMDTNSVREIRKLHLNVCTAMEKVNLIFACHISVETTATQIYVACLLFWLIRLLNSPVAFLNFNVAICASFATPIWRLLGASLAGEFVSSESRRTTLLVQRALVLASARVSSEHQRELERFAEQLAACCAELRTVGGARVGLGLLGSAMGATLSLLIIMFQFVLNYSYDESTWPPDAFSRNYTLNASHTN